MSSLVASTQMISMEESTRGATRLKPQRSLSASAGTVQQSDAKGDRWIAGLNASLPELQLFRQLVAISQAGDEQRKKVGVPTERTQATRADAKFKSRQLIGFRCQPRIQILSKFPRGAVAMSHMTSHRFQADTFQLRRNSGIQIARPSGTFGTNFRQPISGLAFMEWSMPGQHFVENRPQRIDVCAMIDKMPRPQSLLGAHVRW